MVLGWLFSVPVWAPSHYGLKSYPAKVGSWLSDDIVEKLKKIKKDATKHLTWSMGSWSPVSSVQSSSHDGAPELPVQTLQEWTTQTETWPAFPIELSQSTKPLYPKLFALRCNTGACITCYQIRGQVQPLQSLSRGCWPAGGAESGRVRLESALIISCSGVGVSGLLKSALSCASGLLAFCQLRRCRPLHNARSTWPWNSSPIA